MLEKKQNGSFTNTFVPSKKALISFIPPPGKVYMFIHAMIIVQAMIISISSIYTKNLTPFGEQSALSVIIISALCLTANTRFWKIALLSSALGSIFLLILKCYNISEIFFLALKVNDTNKLFVSLLSLFNYSLIIFFYIYSALSLFANKYYAKEKYKPLTLKFFNRYLPFGIIALILYALFHVPSRLFQIWSFIKNANPEFFIHPIFLIAEPTIQLCLFLLIIYYTFQQQKTPLLACLTIFTCYHLLSPVLSIVFVIFTILDKVDMTEIYTQIPMMLEATLSAVVPLFVSIYYIKTSEDAKTYFAFHQENHENSSLTKAIHED